MSSASIFSAESRNWLLRANKFYSKHIFSSKCENSNRSLPKWPLNCTGAKFKNNLRAWAMPNSKHRKRQLATNRRQLEKAKKRLQLQNAREEEHNKENQSHRSEEAKRGGAPGDESSWLGSVYSWCHSGIVQVRARLPCHIFLCEWSGSLVRVWKQQRMFYFLLAL